MLIGITGTLASGKDTVAEILEKKGFQHISLSAILRKLVRQQGLDDSVASLTKFGNEVRRRYGEGYLVKQALKKITEKNAIISSVRQTGEVKTIKEEPNSHLIVVDAPIRLRYQRLCSRGRADDPKTFEEFKKIEQKQSYGKEGGMNLKAVFKMADFKINNKGNLAELKTQVDKILEKIG